MSFSAIDQARVAVLVGSVRPDGFSARIARTLVALAPPELDLRLVSITDLSFYDQDAEASPPPGVIAFRDAIRSADAILFVTAEYNRSVPAVLKNALDVGSRPAGEAAFAGKPAAIVSQSPGAMGGICANHALRPSLMALNMPVLAQPEMYLMHVGTMFDATGTLTPAAPVLLMTDFLAVFARFLDRHGD